MASRILLPIGVTGLTITTRLFSLTADTLIETISYTEKTNSKGWYYGDTVTTNTGTHRLEILVSGTTDGAAYVELSNTSPTEDRAASTQEAAEGSSVVISAAAAALDNVNEGGKITIHRGDHTSFQLTGLGSLTGRTGEKLFFTVKSTKDDDLTDADAIIQVSETTGAIRVNGAAHATASDASIVVDDATDGDITITIKAAITKLLSPSTRLYYDIQKLDASGFPSTLTQGNLKVNADVTRRESLA